MYRIAFAIAAALAAGPALAGTPINQTHPLSANGEVHIENIKGSIIVRTWARPEVRITGDLGKGVEKLDVSGDSHSLDIEVKYPNSRGGWSLWGSDDKTEPTRLEVTIPQRASVDVEAVSADVDVQQVAGRKLDVSSVSGSIVVTASSPGEARFENVSGDITLRITTPNVHVESVSGDIKLSGGLTGEVSMETVSGNLVLGAKDLDLLKTSTVSGDTTLRAGLKADATVKAETLSGSLALTLARAASARVHVETFSGDIDSPVGKVDREEHGPGKSLDTRLGDGSGDIHLESFSGDVSIVLE
jgi:hypothetical protein